LAIEMTDDADRRRDFKAAWSEAVHTTHEGSVAEMLALLDSPWPQIRSHIVRALRKHDQPEVVPRLIERAAREKDDSVRSSIALALRDFQDERAVETLWTMCEEGPDDVRLPALQGLSRLGDDRVIPIATSWYQSGDQLKRTLAIYDLSLMQTPNGEKALADLIAAESNWRRRASNRRTLRRARKWRSRHG
jgi:HEAT repeat protein